MDKSVHTTHKKIILSGSSKFCNSKGWRVLLWFWV